MPQQDPETQEKEPRRHMREGRTPLLEAVRAAYPPYLIARKGYNRKNEEVRDQLNLLNSTFSTSTQKLRQSARNTADSGEGMPALYEAMSKQAKEVATFIDKELPGLKKLYEPVGKLHATYQQALDAYHAYMEGWKGRLPESDLSGRALELVQQEIERSLR